MTVKDILDLSEQNFKNTKLGDASTASRDVLFDFMKVGLMELAKDTRDWIDGEIVTQTSANSYNLTGDVIIIAGAFNKTTGEALVEGSVKSNGYLVTSPATIFFNYVNAGDEIQVNYYTYLKFAGDYTTEQATTVDISPALINALHYFMLHKAILTYKDQSGLIQTNDYRSKYKEAVREYLSARPERNFQVIQQDMILTKGFI